MNKSIFNTAVAVAVAAVFCVGCGGGGGSRPASLTGQWVDVDDGSGAELFSDGTAAFKKDDLSVSGTWSIVDKRLVTTISVGGTSMSMAYNYKLSGYELTLVDDKGDTSISVRKEKLKEFKEKQIAATKRDVEKTPTFTDSRDGKTYRRVLIGEQVWMAENLNYAAEDSKCYENSDDNCAKYGRLYNCSTAKKACPAGWHLPSGAEWKTLVDYAGGDSTAGKKLKSASGWKDSGNGTDDYGFSALPSGFCHENGSFNNVGVDAGLWSATEDNTGWGALRYAMSPDDEKVDRSIRLVTRLYSLRCLQD